MTHEPASRPISLRAGVSGTSGRPSAPTPRPPQLDDEARSLIESLLAGGSTVSSEAMLKLAEQVPSRSGVQALTYLAWSCREAARKNHTSDASPEVVIAEVLEKLSANAARRLDTMASLDALAGTVEKSIGKAYSAGHSAGWKERERQLAEDRSQPVRRTEFVSDAAGHITGKVEYELKPGGKTS